MEVSASTLLSSYRPSVRGRLPLVRCRHYPTIEFRDSASMRRAKGFTLLELMIAVMIIAVLTLVAIPSYQFAVRKGNRGDAQAFMLDVAQREQQIFLDSRRYIAVADNGEFLTEINLAVPQGVGKHYVFDVALDAGPPPAFTITATPIAGGMQVRDGALTMDSLGNKTPADKW